MNMLARVVHPPGIEAIGVRDAHPSEKYLSVDANGFLQTSPETSGYDVAEGVYKVASYVWDADGMVWVRATQSTSDGGTSTVTTTKQKRFDRVSSTLLYLGEADPGASESAPSWRIRRIQFDANGFPTSVTYAALGGANQAWSSRDSLTYS